MALLGKNYTEAEIFSFFFLFLSSLNKKNDFQNNTTHTHTTTRVLYQLHNYLYNTHYTSTSNNKLHDSVILLHICDEERVKRRRVEDEMKKIIIIIIIL